MYERGFKVTPVFGNVRLPHPPSLPCPAVNVSLCLFIMYLFYFLVHHFIIFNISTDNSYKYI